LLAAEERHNRFILVMLPNLVKDSGGWSGCASVSGFLN